MFIQIIPYKKPIIVRLFTREVAHEIAIIVFSVLIPNFLNIFCKSKKHCHFEQKIVQQNTSKIWFYIIVIFKFAQFILTVRCRVCMEKFYCLILHFIDLFTHCMQVSVFKRSYKINEIFSISAHISNPQVYSTSLLKY